MNVSAPYAQLLSFPELHRIHDAVAVQINPFNNFRDDLGIFAVTVADLAEALQKGDDRSACSCLPFSRKDEHGFSLSKGIPDLDNEADFLCSILLLGQCGPYFDTAVSVEIDRQMLVYFFRNFIGDGPPKKDQIALQILLTRFGIELDVQFRNVIQETAEEQAEIDSVVAVPRSCPVRSVWIRAADNDFRVQLPIVDEGLKQILMLLLQMRQFGDGLELPEEYGQCALCNGVIVRRCALALLPPGNNDDAGLLEVLDVVIHLLLMDFQLAGDLFGVFRFSGDAPENSLRQWRADRADVLWSQFQRRQGKHLVLLPFHDRQLRHSKSFFNACKNILIMLIYKVSDKQGMCGIVGYVGKRTANALLFKGLQNLEYRGYDSAGIAVADKGKIAMVKAVGRVQNLDPSALKGSIGIGHTRWATHGIPAEHNAHPHADCTGSLVLVHNGIIENFLELREKLSAHHFRSATDSEVLAHLIESQYHGDLHEAVQRALAEVEGAYAIAVLHAAHSEIVVARNGSPLALGIGKGENFIGSDASAFIEQTQEVLFLNDFETAAVTANSIQLFNAEGKKVQRTTQHLDWDVLQAQKHGYKHFMLKEIFEQPAVVKLSLGIQIPRIAKPKRIILVACGTASYAAMVGKYLFEQLGIPAFVEVGSEFRYRNPVIFPGDLCIAISQSGETADTLAAMRLAKEKGAKTLSIVNVVHSTIARESDAVIYTRAGMEVAVASTKAFLSQLIVLYKLAEIFGGKIPSMEKLPSLIQKILDKSEEIRKIAQKYAHAHNFLYLGRGLQYPIALEGAIKLKEISYIHAEGYAAGEMKHGPIALVSDECPSVAIAVRDALYPKTVSNIQEAKARKGKVIAIATEGDAEIKHHCEDVITVPKVEDILYPILTVVPLQLLAYYIADIRDCDVDKPRNLAKSVTVE